MGLNSRERENLVALKVIDIAPDLFNRHFTSICLKETIQFLNLVKDINYNPSPGSYFSDEKKSYFFNPPLCYIIREEVKQ